MVEESRTLLATALAGIATFPIWVFLNLLLAPFRAVAEERRLGDWDAQRFIYYEPKLIGTSVLSHENNSKYADLFADDIPAGTVIDYKIEIEGPKNRVNCIVFGAYFFAPAVETLKSIRFAPKGRVVVRKNKSLRLLAYVQPNTLPTIIRVYALSWHIDSTFGMEYVDESKGVRFTIRHPGADGGTTGSH